MLMACQDIVEKQMKQSSPLEQQYRRPYQRANLCFLIPAMTLTTTAYLDGDPSDSSRTTRSPSVPARVNCRCKVVVPVLMVSHSCPHRLPLPCLVNQSGLGRTLAKNLHSRPIFMVEAITSLHIRLLRICTLLRPVRLMHKLFLPHPLRDQRHRPQCLHPHLQVLSRRLHLQAALCPSMHMLMPLTPRLARVQTPTLAQLRRLNRVMAEHRPTYSTRITRPHPPWRRRDTTRHTRAWHGRRIHMARLRLWLLVHLWGKPRRARAMCTLRTPRPNRQLAQRTRESGGLPNYPPAFRPFTW